MKQYKCIRTFTQGDTTYYYGQVITQQGYALINIAFQRNFQEIIQAHTPKKQYDNPNSKQQYY